MKVLKNLKVGKVYHFCHLVDIAVLTYLEFIKAVNMIVNKFNISFPNNIHSFNSAQHLSSISTNEGSFQIKLDKTTILFTM